MEYIDQLKDYDPEFFELFSNFSLEVINEKGIELDEKTRFLAIMATLLGNQSLSLYQDILCDALKTLTPIEIKEVIYQAVAYLGIGKVYPFFKVTNDEFTKLNITFPLDKQATTNQINRREKGTQAQVKIFGENMKDFYKTGPQETVHINRWLASNCFGDYYTRNGLDHKQREMITFCFLVALGTEPQLKGHINGNINVGNDKMFLIAVASQCMPYNGYPKTLNAIRCIQEVCCKE